MSTSQVRYRRATEELLVDGEVVAVLDRGYSPNRFVVDANAIGDATLSSIRQALIHARHIERFDGAAEPDEFDTIQLVLTPGPDMEWAQPQVTLGLVGSGKLRLEVEVAVVESPSSLHDSIEALARGHLVGTSINVISVWSYENDDYDFYLVVMSLEGRGRTIQELYSAGERVYQLCTEFLSHEYSVRMFRSILRGGRPELLIGQYENRWFESKSAAYDLDKPAQRVELAQDVTRFANSENEGLLVIGLGTKKDQTGDRVVSVHPLGVIPKATRMHKALDQLVYPPIDGLEVDLLPAEPGRPSALMAIYVPAQAEELKPFLVAGAVVHGKVEGAFISIVRRRGEHSIPVTPQAIHTALATGRALLRRGDLPRDK